LATPNAARAQSNSCLKLDATRVSWTHLSFHARNYWVEVSTDIQLGSITASELGAVLLHSPEGTPIKLLTSEASQMTINTVIDPRFRSPVNIYNRIWFNPTDASALGRIRLRRGEDDFKKMYRFTEQGVFRHRLEPKDKNEERLEPENWTDIKDSFYAYDITRLGCPAVTERSVLLYILSAATVLKDKDPLSLCVFDKRQLHRVRLQQAGVSPIKVDYIEKGKQEEIRRQGIVKALKINLSSEPMDSDLKTAENFSFLGFHRNISLYLDPISHLPVQASGIIPAVGNVHLKLRETLMK
jgi:hypothetical protein